MISDEALMLDFQRGSREAFEELFARYRGPLHGFFHRRLDSCERAEDLAQETFLALVRGASRYEPRAQFRTYLYGIALKLLAAERRKHKTTPLEEIDHEPAAGELPDKQHVHVVPHSTSTRLSNAAVDGYETMVAGLINILLFLASAGPSILLWGAILFFPARWAWKKWRQRNQI